MFSEWTTSLRLRARLATSATSTVPAILRAAVADEDSYPHGATSASVPGVAPEPLAPLGSAPRPRGGLGGPRRLLGGARRLLGSLLRSLALFLSLDDGRLGDHPLDQRLGVDHVLVQLHVGGAEAQGQAQHLRQVENGHLVVGAQEAVDLRLLQIEVDVAERAAHHDGLGPSGQRLLDDLAAQPPLDLGLGHAHAGAAALGLVVPPLDVGAGGLQQQVHLHGLLVVALVGEVARPAQKAAVVRHHLELREVGLDQRGDLLLAHEVHQVFGKRVDHDLAVVGLVEHLVDLGPEGVVGVDLYLRVLLALVAGGAGSQQLVAHLGRLAQVARGQGLSQQVVHHVSGGGAAARPVRHFLVLHAKNSEHLAGGDVELARRLVQRATGVVSEAHAATSPLPAPPDAALGAPCAPPGAAAAAAPAASAEACARALASAFS